MRALVLLAVLGACGRVVAIGQPPALTPADRGPEPYAMQIPVLPVAAEDPSAIDGASLWSGAPGSLLGDRRARERGDILTVVIEIDEEASFSNSTDRQRRSDQSLSIGDLFGLPEMLQDDLPDGATFEPAVGITASGGSAGDGATRRQEQLTLRIAATVVGVLPNGVLQIEGTQEVRVNFELRALHVTGFVRPEDISRQNEITYDKIAAARISYGGRGQITDVQQPRIGQQVADVLLPF